MMQIQSGTPTKLQSLIKEGLDGHVSLIGYPHDIGNRRSEITQGQDHGPDCLRRFLPKIGPLINSEYRVDIAKISVSDYGNIYIDGQEGNGDTEHLIEKLQKKIQIVRGKGNIPLIIGGGHEAAYSCYKTLVGSTRVISIIQTPDVQKPFDGNKVSSTSAARLWYENDQNSKTCTMTYFGHNTRGLTIEEKSFMSFHKIREVDLNTIRRKNIIHQHEVDQPYTQAGQSFKELLDQIHESYIHISFSLEAIDSAFCPGISRPAISGLNAEESVEIMYLAGQDKRVTSLDICDYNPTIEDYRTGYLFANMIYFFLMGSGQKY